MRTLAAVSLAWFVFALCLGAWSCTHRQVTPQVAHVPLPEHEPPDPGDLEPLHRQVREAHFDVLSQVLAPDARAVAWMVKSPSFTPESYVAIAANDRGTREEPTWSLHVVRATEFVAKARREGREPVVERHVIPLDEDDALLLVGAWDSVVRRTRNPKPVYVLFADGTRIESVSASSDGVAYQFGTRRFLGQTHSPDRGLAFDIVSLGDQLADLPFCSPDVRESVLANCRMLAAEMQRKAEAFPW